MNNTEKIQELKELYKDLFKLIEPYYTKYNEIGLYMDTIENIVNYISNTNDNEKNILLNVFKKTIRGFNRFDDVMYEKTIDAPNIWKKINSNEKRIRELLK